MKTDDILNLDCTVAENRTKLNKFLCKIKPIKRMMGEEIGEVPIEVLEAVLHGLCIKYKYRTQGINTYIEDETDRFVFYQQNVLKIRETRDWIGVAYGKTLWEVVAKTIIKIYADILKERKNKDGE